MAYIDTLKAFDDLVASGINEKQARTQVNVLDSSFNGIANKLDSFATKDDLKNLEERLDNDITTIETDVKELRVEVRELRGDFRKHLLAIIGSIAGGVIIMIIATRSILLKLI